MIRNEQWPFIQALRGLASLSVVVFHSLLLIRKLHEEISPVLNSLLMLGEIGVDIFFIISGYVMVVVVSNVGEAKGLHWLKGFLGKRFWRVMIPYWAFTFIAFIILTVIPSGKSEYKSLSESLLLIPSDTPFYLMLGWSLVYEVWFYLVFGICVFVGQAELGAGLAALFCIAFALIGYCKAGQEVVFGIYNLTMPTYFAIGILLSIVRHNISGLFSRFPKGAIVSGLLLSGFASAWLFFIATGDISGGRLSTLGIAAVAIFLSIWALSKELRYVGWLGLQKLGDWSYSLYLSHWLVINALAYLFVHLNVRNLMTTMFLSVLVCISVAYFCWRYFERGVIRLGHKLFE